MDGPSLRATSSKLSPLERIPNSQKRSTERLLLQFPSFEASDPSSIVDNIWCSIPNNQTDSQAIVVWRCVKTENGIAKVVDNNVVLLNGHHVILVPSGTAQAMQDQNLVVDTQIAGNWFNGSPDPSQEMQLSDGSLIDRSGKLCLNDVGCEFIESSSLPQFTSTETLSYTYFALPPPPADYQKIISGLTGPYIWRLGQNEYFKGNLNGGNPSGQIEIFRKLDNGTLEYYGEAIREGAKVMPHGKGIDTARFNSGTVVEWDGNWNKGKFFGEGTMTINGVATRGKWKAQNPDGKMEQVSRTDGVTITCRGTMKVFNYVIVLHGEGTKTIQFKSGKTDIHTGTWEDGTLLNGKREVVFNENPTETIFVEDGNNIRKATPVPDQPGIFKITWFSNENSFEGKITKDGERKDGEMKWLSSGEEVQRFKGKYVNERETEGTLTIPGKTLSDEISIKGRWNGLDKQIRRDYPNGSFFEGDFDGREPKVGTFIEPEVRKRKGTFENGELVGKGAEWAWDKKNGQWCNKQSGNYVNGVLQPTAPALTSQKNKKTPLISVPFKERKPPKTVPSRARGEIYDGETETGPDGKLVKHGKGVLTKNSVTYKGSWVEDNLEGEATVIYPNKDVYTGWLDPGTLQRHGQGTLRLSDGTVCSGSFANNDPQGATTTFFADKSVFVGEVEIGKEKTVKQRKEAPATKILKNGQGELTSQVGVVTTGIWRGDKLDRTQVTILYTDRSSIKGSVNKEHLLEGIGTKTLTNGNQVTGVWTGGEIDTANDVIIQYPNGFLFNGHVNNALQAKDGILARPNGDRLTGRWANGVLNQNQVTVEFKDTSSFTKFNGALDNQFRPAKGTWTLINGNEITGHANNGELDPGDVTIVFKNSTRFTHYKGALDKSLQPIGRGTWTKLNGDKVSGNFKDGKLDRNGVDIEFPDGSKFHGALDQAFKPYGEGTLKRGNETISGKWIEDQFVQTK